MARAKILLTDDDALVRESIALLLRRADFEVTEAGSAAETLAHVGDAQFDVLLTDVVMPDDQSLAYLEHVVRADPAMAVLVMTGHASVDTAVRALRGGAIDYLQKPFSSEALISAVLRGVETTRASRAAGELKTLAGDLQQRMRTLEEALRSPGRIRAGVVSTSSTLRPELLEKLSPREQEIVLELHANKSVNEAAETLSISVHTVRNHVKSAFKKLGVHSQSELLDLLRGDASD